jgi:hypothetical protein
VLLGEGRDADAEVAGRPHQAHELLGVLQALRVLHPVGLRVAGRVAAQGEHVAHPAAANEPTIRRSSATLWSTAVR